MNTREIQANLSVIAATKMRTLSTAHPSPAKCAVTSDAGCPWNWMMTLPKDWVMVLGVEPVLLVPTLIWTKVEELVEWSGLGCLNIRTATWLTNQRRAIEGRPSTSSSFASMISLTSMDQTQPRSTHSPEILRVLQKPQHGLGLTSSRFYCW